MNLTDLPDEVLVLIFDLLEGGDKLMLNQTCQRFSDILNEKRLSRKLDLGSSYSVCLSNMKLFFKPKIKRENLREFNITSCYWITSSDISTLVKKMVNLEALYTADTLLSKEHLIILLQSLPQLKRLSFTWRKTKDPGCSNSEISAISTRLNALEFISFYLKCEELTMHDTILILNWLHFCSALKELRMIGVKQLYYEQFPSSEYIKPIRFPQLHTMVLSVPGYPFAIGQVAVLYHLLMEATIGLKNWQCLWITPPIKIVRPAMWPDTVSDANTLVTTILDKKTMREKLWNNIFHSSTEKLPNMEHFVINTDSISIELLTLQLPKLKKLSWKTTEPVDWNALWNLYGSLEELNIGSCLKDIKQICFQDSLTKLALPTCILKGDMCQSSSKGEQSNTVMRILVEACPNIREFEFTSCSICSFTPSHISYEPGFAVFGEWKDLRRLKLEGLECIRTGKPFSHIFKMCEKLENISLKNLGQHGSCNYLFELFKGLENCKNLKDFRLEQANIQSINRLLVALRMCSKLERICIICHHFSNPPENKTLIDMIRKLERLIFLYMDITQWTQSCKQLARVLNNKFKSSRPAFHATFLCSSFHRDVVALPGIHYFEMAQDLSRISTRPGNGKKFLENILIT